MILLGLDGVWIDGLMNGWRDDLIGDLLRVF